MILFEYAFIFQELHCLSSSDSSWTQMVIFIICTGISQELSGIRKPANAKYLKAGSPASLWLSRWKIDKQLTSD